MNIIQLFLLLVKNVPSREAWMYENPEQIGSILRGIKDIEAGRVVKLNLSEADLG